MHQDRNNKIAEQSMKAIYLLRLYSTSAEGL